jgi:hypothetical protein
MIVGGLVVVGIVSVGSWIHHRFLLNKMSARLDKLEGKYR